jgi:hypothetical protein
MTHHVRFSTSRPQADRIYHITEADVRTVLGRLPHEIWSRLRAVHFNDRSIGARVLGYVNRGHREIAICALPPRISLSRFLRRGQSPSQFGALRGRHWPQLAIRRFLLYDVFLHELGHLQVVRENAQSDRLKFAREKFAQEFADAWRAKLWATRFADLDPVHNPPAKDQLVLQL